MGLHNKFPSYFYKRGNLFNTYLGHTESPEPPTRSTQSKRKRRPAEERLLRQAPTAASQKTTRRSQTAPTRPVGPHGDAQAFVGLARQHLTIDQGRILLRLISADRGQPMTPANDPGVWDQLAYFCSVSLTPAQVNRYKRALESRLERGEPLIQKT
jgi:hypothetical protein